MSSLRARVLASVLVLAAVGMIAVAAITYAEQRSFLYSRVDQQTRAAVPYMSRLLDSRGFRPGGTPGFGQGEPGPGTGFHGGGPPGFNPPPGTYGERRNASGEVLGHESFNYGQTPAGEPKLPSQLPLNTSFTVGSVAAGGPQYRVYARQDPEDSGVTVVAVPLSDTVATLHRLLLVEALVIAVALIALGATAFFVVRLGLRPLSRIEVTAGQIAAGDLSRRVSPADERTEVGRLGLALNAMLERLEQAFAARTASEERLRQFLADASHELRTPLASIRGYAELFRLGAVRDSAGTENAMRRIEEESARMGVLVEDMLALARLEEQPDRPKEPVDLTALARDAVQDARARAPEREVSLAEDGPAVVIGDELQLRQVFTNLLGNAIVHTPDGSPIEVVVHGGAEQATLSVSDHGPGIPAEERERLFERFWRREGGRERGRAGAGLGLAIVQGVVDAHGGSVEIREVPGGGASFVVTLPTRTAPGPDASAPGEAAPAGAAGGPAGDAAA
jgi:two-component system OmpR family sensor kinase